MGYFFRLIYRVCQAMWVPDEVTKAIIQQRRVARRGEKFIVSWSRSTSASSICRYHFGSWGCIIIIQGLKFALLSFDNNYFLALPI